MSKIKLKITGESFPEEFKGKVVEVEVTGIIMPDGTGWAVDNHQYSVEESREEVSVAKSKSLLQDFFGQKMSSMTVDFRDE